jgi:hypothetical protein
VNSLRRQSVGCIWGIEERKWGGEFERRMMMFQSMVESVLMYGTEIWGWKEQEERRRNTKVHSEGKRSRGAG